MNSVNQERQLSKGVCAGVSPLGFCPSALSVDWPNLPSKVSCWSGWFLMGGCDDVQI